MTNEKLLQELRRSRNALDALIEELITPSQPRRSSIDDFRERIKAGTWKRSNPLSKKTRPKKQV